MENIVLVRPRSYINIVTPPLGIGYLFKGLDGLNNINRIFIDRHRNDIKEGEFLDRLKTLNPLILGFQVFSVNYAELRRLAPKIRKVCPQTKIIAGGPHISGLPEQTLIDNPEIDFLIKSEGEESLRLLTLGLLEGSLNRTIKDIPNLVYRDADSIVSNRPQLVDVDKYGPPDWKILEPDKYPPVQHGTFHKTNRVVPILTSRGCPYPCTFCAGYLITGKHVRRRNAKSIVDEIEFLQSSYGFREIIVEDENFTFYKDHVVAISDELKKRDIKCFFSFPNGIRLDRVDEEIVYHLKRMGTYIVNVGIESGSIKTLKAMKKRWNLEIVKDKIRLLRKNGIIVHGSFILGFSDETMEDIKKTINFAVTSGVDTAFFGNYIPLPGSEDFNRLVNKGELKVNDIKWDNYTSYFGRLPYHPRDVSERQLLKAVRWGTIRFYARPKIIFNLLKRMSHPVFFKSLIFRTVSLFRQDSGSVAQTGKAAA